MPAKAGLLMLICRSASRGRPGSRSFWQFPALLPSRRPRRCVRVHLVRNIKSVVASGKNLLSYQVEETVLLATREKRNRFEWKTYLPWARWELFLPSRLPLLKPPPAGGELQARAPPSPGRHLTALAGLLRRAIGVRHTFKRLLLFLFYFIPPSRIYNVIYYSSKEWTMHSLSLYL